MSEIYIENGIRYRNLDFVLQPDYRVGVDDSFWSRKNNKWGIGPWKRMKKFLNANGYNVVCLSDGRGRKFQKWFAVSHLVLEAFVESRPEGMECCHNDGVRNNDKLENLRWDTPSNNQQDRKKHGTDQYGENNARSKLTNEIVLEIRRQYATGNFTQRFLARKFGISDMSMCNIVNRKQWKHLKDDGQIVMI